MPSLLEDFVKAFIPLFVAIDPIGLAAVFLALGQGTPPDLRRRIARQATWTGGGVALLFLFLGQSIFAAIGITTSDFQIAGGHPFHSRRPGSRPFGGRGAAQARR